MAKFHFLRRHYLRLYFLLAGLVLALISFEEVVDDVFFDPLEGDLESVKFDQSIKTWMGQYRSLHLTQVMADFTSMGSVSVLATLLIILISILATFRDFKRIFFLGIVGIGAGVLPYLLKLYFNRERPAEMDHLVTVTDLSFPSGHSFGAAAIYISLAYISVQYARSRGQEILFYTLGGFLITIVGISRIYLGVHYPTDVLAGISGGLAWGFFISAIFEVQALRNPKT